MLNRLTNSNSTRFIKLGVKVISVVVMNYLGTM